MWFILSLIALVCWSGSDLFSKIGSRPDDRLSHWKMVMAVGLVMGLHATYEVFVNGVEISWRVMAAYLPASFLYILSMILGYVGLRYIELSISSPICNTSGAVAAVFLFIFLREDVDLPVWIGVIFVAVGVVSLGIVEKNEDQQARDLRQSESGIRYRKSVLALLLPILYCLIDAAGTVADTLILDGGLNEASANVAYEYTFLLMGIAAAVYVLIIRKDRITVKREGPKLLGGICETAGQFAYIFAISDEAHYGSAAAIISCYCALSVLWSRIFLKEKLSLKHYLAILTAFVGIAILGYFDA